jgi:hypothetical protein
VIRKDAIWALALATGAFALYAATAAPSVATVFDDSLEFQVVLPTLGIAHPSGYPLYTLLGFLTAKLLPFRDPAGRVNLLSALAAAAAIGVFFLVARRIAGSRAAAAVAAVALAVSPVWWSQATLAEVYALHVLLAALFLYFLLRWEESGPRTTAARADRYLIAAALVAGLGMAHHRMIALWLPAALVFILWTDPGLLRQPRRWVKPLAAGLAPLLLYLYLPLRAQNVSSTKIPVRGLDGTFVPTAQGTLDWITARAYSVFLTGNPFGVERTAGDVAALFLDQFGALFLLAALLGLLTGWRTSPRRWVFLLMATAAQVAFASAYKVQDVGVFFLPAFMLTALWAAWGLTPIFDSLAIYAVGLGRGLRLPGALRPLVLGGAALLVATVVLFEPMVRARQGFPEQDRSHVWGVYEAGQDAINHVAPGGEVTGLLGETTLLRYFRDVLGQRPDVTLTPADAEGDRMAAVEGALAEGRPIYITRDLPGAAARYSLDAAGPLIAVSPKVGAAPAPDGAPMGAGVILTEISTEVRSTRGGSVVRVRPVWSAAAPIGEELKISARLLDPAGNVVVADDRVPVHFTYPTTAWVPGERVEDNYDLAVPAGAPARPYRVLLILYRAADGSEVGRTEVVVS